MILNTKQIREILSENPTRKVWAQAVIDNRLLRTHVLGHEIKSYLETIQTMESPRETEVRKKYCRTNRDLFARVLRPIDAIWNGKGGGKTYLTSEAIQKKIQTMILDIWKGRNLDSWTKHFWLPRYKDDPMGIIFMEVDLATPNKVYPTYKGSFDVFDARISGRRLEYLVLKTKDPEIFRVVDDAKDIHVKMKGTGENAEVRILNTTEHPHFINHFGQVPALIVSDIPKDGQEGLFASPIWDEIQLADQFLREGSITGIYRLKQGFPVGWTYPEVCGTCKGSKVMGANPCADCNGQGIKTSRTPGEMSVYAWPTKDEVEIREKGGYISPDIKYLEYADEHLYYLEELIFRTHWGTDRVENNKKGEKETATGRFIDAQPVTNRQADYAKAAESVEEFICDHIGRFNFPGSYLKTAINLGRRFVAEPPDTLWTKYETARKNGAPLASLDELLRDYYESKHQANEDELKLSLAKMRLEPGVHLSIAEAKTNLPWVEYIKKVYFQAFLQEKSDLQIKATPIKILAQELETYAVKKAEAAPQDPMAPKLDENNNPLPPKKDPADKGVPSFN